MNRRKAETRDAAADLQGKGRKKAQEAQKGEMLLVPSEPFCGQSVSANSSRLPLKSEVHQCKRRDKPRAGYGGTSVVAAPLEVTLSQAI